MVESSPMMRFMELNLNLVGCWTLVWAWSLMVFCSICSKLGFGQVLKIFRTIFQKFERAIWIKVYSMHSTRRLRGQRAGYHLWMLDDGEGKMGDNIGKLKWYFSGLSPAAHLADNWCVIMKPPRPHWARQNLILIFMVPLKVLVGGLKWRTSISGNGFLCNYLLNIKNMFHHPIHSQD